MFRAMEGVKGLAHGGGVNHEVVRPLDAARGFALGRGPVTYIENHDHTRLANSSRMPNANILLDATMLTATLRTRRVVGLDPEMEKMSEQETFDAGTLAPSCNFIYAFEKFRFFVSDDWMQVLSDDETGRVLDGSLNAVEQAQVECRCRFKFVGQAFLPRVSRSRHRNSAKTVEDPPRKSCQLQHDD